MSKPKIRIVGTNTLQNDLLARFLEKEIGGKCICSTNNYWDLGSKGNNGGRHLPLLDFQSLEWETFSAQLGSRNGSGSQPTFAFFNVCPVDDSRVISKELLAHGLRGVFNEGESLEIMGRGIRAMLNGELWIPRKNLEALLLETESETFSTTCQGTNLTSREREIILIVASGASNQQIADQLFISPHTVLTHLHNLFTKINVTSRLQAALWVASNLQSHSPIMSVKPPPPSNHFVLKN
jgi:LuxR family transcriptional regulator of csgAB operon